MIHVFQCCVILLAVFGFWGFCIYLSQVYLSTRRGTWVFHRIGPGGMPFDLYLSRRFPQYLNRIMPRFLVNMTVTHLMNSRLDHDLYGLKADYPPLAQHPLVNDDLGNRIACGSVKIKADVKRITETGVEFVDGSVEDNIDVVSSCRLVGWGVGGGEW